MPRVVGDDSKAERGAEAVSVHGALVGDGLARLSLSMYRSAVRIDTPANWWMSRPQCGFTDER